MNRDGITLPLNLVGSFGPGAIVMGVVIGREPNRLVVWHRDNPQFPHLQVSGSTGVGKSSPFRCVAAHQLHHHWPLIMLEPGGLGENEWVGKAAARVSTLAGARLAYRDVRAELDRRLRLMADRGVTHYTQIPGLPPVQILGDELPSLTGDEAVSDEWEAELVDGLISDMVEVGRKGRKAGIHQAFITQRPTIEATFVRAGGVIQGTTQARIHMGDRDTVSLQAVFRNSSGLTRRSPVVRLLEASPGPGRALYTRLNPKDRMDVMAGQMWWIDPEQAAIFADRYDGPAPLDYDTRAQEVHA